MRNNASLTADEVELRPLSARSVVLSLLLGLHPPELPVKDLVGAVEPFGIAPSTLRAALSRMVAAGDLRRADTVHGLSERLLERQRRQDDAVHPATRPWGGDWEMVVVTATGRGAAERAELRTELTRLRLAELREGVWLRPANLRRTLPDDLGEVAQCYTARPERAARELAADLWPLDAWAATGRALLTHVEGARRPSDRFTGFAAVVRHLLADPVLPPPFLPADWPGERLRAAYADYRRELAEDVRARGLQE
ncbi:PaaX domain-containing protein, C- domain protein [Streptomyces viridochromogenes]|uniref:PaaX domain-containing protein, C-domain protein n=1 Tax=Streptomyces viridochromogenes TaxID=1938 RepID=A0A0J7ZHI6_STRVR|nr:PaaX family transcriptional regulator C-terminal domain-containing protein [Streptomyces viridochromogenes]KMS75349.1 PaaX domain-containing protein, C- domain protein [Streptomyces viridochromogenes]KOG19525.1 PaaX domain-containing protein, C- domain protein [Streptomyces viridochromogenes]KOG20929.1 PaaX domain-containing protein, C- domain protein [Streptomyces viridochromogenes]